MKLSVLERFSQGKSLCGYTEDRIVDGSAFMGILDGSPGPLGTGQAMITAILDQAVARLEAMQTPPEFAQLVELLTADASAAKAAAGVQDLRRTGGYVFCLFVPARGEIWRVGDCKFLNNGWSEPSHFPAEELSAKVRAMMIEARLADGYSVDEIMAQPDYDTLIAAQLADQSRLLNRVDHALSIGAINGTAVPLDLQNTYGAQAGRLVITSDGYPQVADTLAETETRLKTLLTVDPLCIGANLQCKGMRKNRLSFDDRSYLSLELG
jgi:hypothetical protein